MKVRVVSSCALLIGSLLSIPLSAETIALGINGNAQVGSNFINFGVFPTGTPYAAAPGSGTFVVSLVNPGVFASSGVTAGETGNIESLSSTVPVVQPWMTFHGPGGTSIQLDLGTVLPGSTVGPFNLNDTPNGAVASFDVTGMIVGATTPESFTGTFSATFNGTTVAQLLSEEASGMTIDTPFSATFSTSAAAVPEPGSMLLFGLGLTTAGLIARRKRR